MSVIEAIMDISGECLSQLCNWGGIFPESEKLVKNKEIPSYGKNVGTCR